MESSRTKKLAAQLGLLPCKRKAAEQESNSRKKKKGQQLSYVIVIDFESTCWENKKGQQEIIEFPAVLLNLQTGSIESEFHQYVLPEENPLLSDFCKQLTGITQDQVNNHGVPLKTCLYLFSRWIEKSKEEKKKKLMEPDQVYDDEETLCAFVTWTDWDFGVCLHYECRRKQIRKCCYFNQWIDVRALYTTFYDRRPSGLNGALEDLGITFAGRQHSGIDDARNTAKLCYRMVKDGCKLKITKCIQQQVHKTIVKASTYRNRASNSIASCKVTSKQDNSSVQTVRDGSHCLDVKVLPIPKLSTKFSPEVHLAWGDASLGHDTIGKALDSVKLKQKRDNDEVMMEELDGESGHSATNHRNRTGKCLITHTGECCIMKQNGLVHQKFLKPFICNNISTLAQSNKTITRTTQSRTPSRTEYVCHIAPVTLLSHEYVKHSSASKGDNCRSTHTTTIEYQDSVSIPSPVVIESSTSTSQACPDAYGSSKLFSTRGALLTPNTSESQRLTSQPSNSAHKIVATPQNSTLDHVILPNSVKITPPVCSCGRRTKRKTVCTPGPNVGKPFFVCPNSSGSNKKHGCGFFKWEYHLLSIPQENQSKSSDFQVSELEYFD